MTEQQRITMGLEVYNHLKSMKEETDLTWDEFFISLTDAASKYEETLNKTT